MKKLYVLIFFISFFITGLIYPLPTNMARTSASTNTGTNTQFLQEFYDQEKSSQENEKKIQAPNPVWNTIKILFYTAVFGVAAYFVVRFIIKKGSLPFTEDEKIVETLLTKSVGMGSFIQIVKVGTSYYILSLSNDGLHLIDKITDQETIDYIELNKEKIKPKETKFFDFLSYLPLSKKTDKFDFLKNQKDRLKKL